MKGANTANAGLMARALCQRQRVERPCGGSIRIACEYVGLG